MSIDILREAKELYDKGAAVHWIRPNSKAPVKSGWTNPRRDTWNIVEKDYREGYGLGVRLGESSKMFGGYLANIDVDIKSSDPRHKEEALKELNKRFPGLIKVAPIVKTGYGLRLFVKTREPVKSGKLASSSEETVVLMPTAEINKRQLLAVEQGLLTKEALEQGYRVRAAWELEFMSAGRQVVLPPSIHPETKRPYVWDRPINGSLPGVKIGGSSAAAPKLTTTALKDFEPATVDVAGSKLPGHIKAMILTGENVENRSNALLPVAKEMFKYGFTEKEILTVLTDRSTYLGETAYNHAKTDDRTRAANWILKYTLPKAKDAADATKAFELEVTVAPLLDDSGAEAQQVELLGTKEERKRRALGLDLTKAGKPQDSLKNVLKILRYEYGDALFRLDKFSDYNVYGLKTTWGGEVGEEFKDSHRPLLTEWFVVKWGFQPKANDLYDAVVILARYNSFHPLQDYLNSLVWDGKPRLDTWLKDYMNAHDVHERYLREVSRKFVVALVARAFDPGCQFDYVLTLRGAQGIKKSTALAALVGAKYFSSTVLHAGDKDSILKMRNKWLIELGELSTVKADVRMLKNFITTKDDRDRLPYGRLAQDFKRTCILVGTTNQDDFLVDETGDRRFWPVTVGAVDRDAIVRDRDQLFAEAKVLYDAGEQIYLSDEAEAEAKVEQAKWKPMEDVLVERIAKVLELNLSLQVTDINKISENGFSLSEIMNRINAKDDMQTQRRVGQALKILGYRQKPSRKTGSLKKLWFKNDEGVTDKP